MSGSSKAQATKRLVAVAGKGGTGKTACVAMMTRALVDNGGGGKLLLIDADPAGGLQCALGTKVRRTMGEVREEVIRTAKGDDQQAKAELADKVEYMAFEALTEVDGYALLAMGRTETMGCYCPVNSLLRGAIASLSKSFDTILIDGEAGLEQVNRQIVKSVDALIVMSDPTVRGLETAAVIKRMVEVEKAMKCKRLGLVFNRVQGSRRALEESAARIGMDVFGMIPYDENVADFDFHGKPVTGLPDDSPSVGAYRDMVAKYVLA